MRLSDTWLAVIFIALAVLMIGMTTTFPPFPGQKYGPAMFPRILAGGMIICSIAIFWRSRNSAEGGRAPALTIDPAFRERTRLVSFLLVPGAILAYLMLSEWLGFIPSAFGILLGMMLWFGVRALTALIVALVMTGLLHWFFGTLMRVPLPRGLFMQIVAGG